MSTIDFLQSFLNAGFFDFIMEHVQIGGSSGNGCPGPMADPDMPATAFTALGAAFATQGYYVQHDMLDYLTFTDMGLWAPLLYVLAAAGGLCSLALGMPPKMYMWFFMGPAIYSWLLGTRVESYGVRWALPCQTRSEQQALQPEVWKLAEPGLVNSNLARRYQTTLKFYKDEMPSQPASVSYLFLWFDDLISGTVFALTEWTGVNSLRGNTGVGAKTNVVQNSTGVGDSKYWYLLSDSKFLLMDEISSAKLHSVDLRDAFATFFQSECGDVMKKVINPKQYISASSSKGRNLPTTVFSDVAGPSGVEALNALEGAGTAGGAGSGRLSSINRQFANVMVPFPRSLRRFVRGDSEGSFYSSVQWDRSKWAQFAFGDTLGCDQYASLLMYGFRWEAAHIGYQLFNSTAPQLASIPSDQLNDSHVVSAVLYGWDLRKNRKLENSGDGTVKVSDGEPLSLNEQKAFLTDLIFLHLFRNELAFVPQPVERRMSNAENIQNYAKGHQRAIGAKNKFGEVYTWAKLIPYVQGVLLYVLAMAYPFACILIVVPGWHKTIFTWMSFWAWVKLWDFGFALVRSMERTIWAMSGNSLDAARLGDRVVEMQTQGASVWGCSGGTKCVVPSVKLLTAGQGPQYDQLVSAGVVNFASTDTSVQEQALELYDRALILAQNLDFDLANGYYIYIMAALYFAVPTVTGQLVLGARSGAAGLVGQMIGGISQEAGRKAGDGFSGDLAGRMKANWASLGQEATAKALRASHPELGAPNGLAAKAMGANVAAMEAGRAAGYAGAAKSGIDKMTTGANSAYNLNRAANPVVWGAAYAVDNALTGGAVLGGGGGGGAKRPKPGETGAVKSADDQDGNSKKTQNLPGIAPQSAENGTGTGTGGSIAQRTGIGPAIAAVGSFLSDLVNEPGAMAKIAATNGAVGAINGALGAPAVYRDAFLKNGVANGDYGMSAEFYPKYQQSLGQQQALTNAEFGYHTAQSQASQTGRMMGAYAENEAAMATWEAKNAMNAQLAGISTALGYYPGSFDPGPKPQGMEYLSMNGQAGQSAFENAWFAMGKMEGGVLNESKGFGADTNFWRAKLDDHFGEKAVVDAYQPLSLMEVAGWNASYQWEKIKDTVSNPLINLGNLVQGFTSGKQNFPSAIGPASGTPRPRVSGSGE